MKPEELLAHAGFVRSLAQSLVVDEHSAADVEQKTWLAALEHPPATDKNLRSWFSRVVRNFVVTLHRSESRRKNYEQKLESEEKITSPDEIALRKEALRRMSEAVFSLEEPYFSTILLRFYEDLPVQEVAARLGVPVETVKTRIQRALKLLRGELDANFGGDRSRWALALAPVAGLTLTSATASAATGIAAKAGAAAKTGTGVKALSPSTVLISAKAKVGILAALILGTTITVYQLIPESPHTSPRMNRISQVAPLEGESPDLALQELSETTQGGDADRTAYAIERDAVLPSGISIIGRVLDKRTNNPIKAFDLQIELSSDEDDLPMIHETIEDQEGRFLFPLAEEGTYTVTVRASRYKGESKDVEVPFKADPAGLTIELDPGFRVKGRVVDDETGKPVQEALVGPAMYPHETDLISLNLLDFNEACPHVYSDDKGRFVLEGLNGWDRRIAAFHPDYAEGYVSTNPDSGEDVEIRLSKGYRIFGRVLNDHGEPVEGLLIRTFGREIPICLPVLTGPDGRYETPQVLPGRIFLEANDPVMTEIEAKPDFMEEHKVVDVVDRDVEVNFGLSENHATWRGTIYGYDGTPLAGARLVISPALYHYREASRFRMFSSVWCDDSGRFEMKKIQPGRWRVEVLIPSEGIRPYWGRLSIDSPGLLEKDLYLSRNGILSGIVVSASTGLPLKGKPGEVWARQRSSRHLRYQSDLDENGNFELRNVTPGIYTLFAKVEDRYSKPLYGIKVEEESRVTDLELLIPPAGEVRLKFVGFDIETGDIYSLSFVSQKDYSSTHYRGTHQLDELDELEESYPVATGLWKVSMAFKDLGYLEKPFEILEDQITEVVIHRNEIRLTTEPLTCSGRVIDRQGVPTPDLLIHFKPDAVPGLVDRGTRETKVDREGYYSIDGMMPGRWSVSAKLPSGDKVSFPQLWIPSDAVTPFHHDMVLYSGAIKGSLFDQQSGLPFTGDQPRYWTARLSDISRNRYVSTYEGGNAGNTFHLGGVPAGDFQLMIMAEGYEDYQSGAFSLGDGQTLDLGEIQLAPCGVLDLEVVDEAFLPLDDFTVTCDGKTRYRSRSLKDKNRYDKLPLGSVSITVRSKGYLEQSIKVQLEPASPVEARVTLIKK
ncbi:MAG: sigma-70 family RNA polymerase sigma factor [Planctomycetota bacterium]|jgi:RNA polymerase sigma-70 factor (ECF subfamily)